MNLVELLKIRSKSQRTCWEYNHRLLRCQTRTNENNKEISNDYKRVKKISAASSHLCLIQRTLATFMKDVFVGTNEDKVKESAK